MNQWCSNYKWNTNQNLSYDFINVAAKGNCHHGNRYFGSRIILSLRSKSPPRQSANTSDNQQVMFQDYYENEFPCFECNVSNKIIDHTYK
jgi:hypothetical protein